MCSMNYQSPTQGASGQQGFGLTPTVVMEPNSQGQAYPTHQYCPQYVQNYQGNQMYSMTSQGQTVGCQGQSCDYQSAGGYSVTSPVDGPSCVGTGGYCYQVPYSQQQGLVPGNQSQMYYTVQNPQSNQTQTAQGYVQYSGQQGTTYQTNTSPPSQKTSVTPSVHPLENVVTQAVNMNNMSSVNTVTPQQQQFHTGAVQGMGTPTGGQFVASFPSSHQMMSHTPHYHQPQAFATPMRPQMVPMPGVPVHGQTTPMAQAFHTVYRPNMPMQIYPNAAHQVQQPLIMAAAAAGMNKPAHHVTGQPSSHVTVSAKGLQCEGKVENGGGENGDVVPGQGPESLASFRSLHQNQG